MQQRKKEQIPWLKRQRARWLDDCLCQNIHSCACLAMFSYLSFPLRSQLVHNKLLKLLRQRPTEKPIGGRLSKELNFGLVVNFTKFSANPNKWQPPRCLCICLFPLNLIDFLCITNFKKNWHSCPFTIPYMVREVRMKSRVHTETGEVPHWLTCHIL